MFLRCACVVLTLAWAGCAPTSAPSAVHVPGGPGAAPTPTANIPPPGANYKAPPATPNSPPGPRHGLPAGTANPRTAGVPPSGQPARQVDLVPANARTGAVGGSAAAGRPAPAAAKPAPQRRAAPQKLTAVAASKLVEAYAGRLGQYKVEILTARREPQFFRIEYRVVALGGERRIMFVTHDGKYATRQLVDMQQRTAELNSDRALTDCLVSKGVKLFVIPGEPKSDEQIASMGPFGNRVLINCSGSFKANCAALGYKAFPVFVWNEGSEVGLKLRAPMAADVGCK